jgi:hypothetical protein
MRRLPLAVLAFALAAPLRADNAADALKKQAGPDADPAKIKTPAQKGRALALDGCVQEKVTKGGKVVDRDQDKEMRAAIDSAVTRLDSCLVRYHKGEMAAKIKKQLKNFKFSCAQEVRSEGGVTTFADDGTPEISMTMHTSMGQYGLPARVFHEMIHAVDPPVTGKDKKTTRLYVVSDDAHNSKPAGFPDPVYGCQFACWGSMYGDRIGDDERKAIARYNGTLSDAGAKEIPMMDEAAFTCPEDFPDCKDADNHKHGYLRQLLTYAWLCQEARPYLPKEAKNPMQRRAAPICIAQQLINGCPQIDDAKKCPAKKSQGALCSAKCEITQAMDAGTGAANTVIDKYKGLGKKFTDAYPKGLATGDEDKPLYDAAKKAGLLAKCLE